MSTNLSLEAETAQMIELYSLGLEKAAAAELEKEAQQRAIEKHIPAVVELLCRTGRIANDEQEKCAAALRDPVKAIEMFKYALLHKSSFEEGNNVPATIVKRDGQTKQASANRADSTETALEAANRLLFG